MKAIDFVVRVRAGAMQRGTLSAEASDQVIVAGSGQEISINARQSDFASQVRSGDQLVITLSDGRTITIDNFFNDTGAANRLFVSADGYLNEVSFDDPGQGNLFAQYGPTSEWGKWSPSDELIFLGNAEVASVPLSQGGEDVSMLGAALLGGGSLLSGGGAAIAAGVGGAALLGGIAGGGREDAPAPTPPFVDDADADVTIGGDGDGKTLTITGGGKPGDEVKVVVGDKQVDTIIDEDGTFETVFEGDTFPDDGVYDSVVTVTPGGDGTDLDGPSFEIDTTPPELVFTQGVESVGDLFNAEGFEGGVTIKGTGEAGSSVSITIEEITQTTVVSETGEWSVNWDAGTLSGGEYTSGITAVTTDSFGNSASFTDTLVVDTVTTVTVSGDVSTTIDGVTVVGDGVINGVEHGEGAVFTGTAQAGSTVEVTIGEVTNTVIATSEGTWSSTFTSAQLAAGEYDGTVSVVSTDVNGNTAQTTGSFTVDTFVRDFSITSSTGGTDGVISGSEVGDPLTVSGMTEPGSSVSVELGGTTVSAEVAANGSWTATFAAGSVASGTYTSTMTATATDAAGNVDTATTSVVVDTEAGLLTIDSTPVEGDDIVNEAEASDGVVLTGTADPGAVVTVAMEGVSHNVTTQADGTWSASFSSAEVAAGVYTAEITATVTDPYGNTRSATDSVEVDTRVDNLAINADIVATDGIVSAAEQDGTVTVTGTTEIGSTSVMVTMAGETVSATIDAEGNWSADFNGSGFEDGTYAADIGVVATDAAGNEKSVSATVQVDTEVTPLDLTTTSAGADAVVNAAEAAAGIDLAGTVEAGSTVVVTFDGTVYDSVTVDGAGNWSVTIPAADVRDGAYAADIVVEATDRVGNTGRIEDTLSIDTDAPDGPIIASFTRGGDGIRGISIESAMEDGTALEQSVVQVASNGSIFEVDGAQGINSRGETNFDFDADVPNGSQLIVNSTDAAGNTSGTFLVLDDEAATNAVDLTNMALGDFQIENLDLDFAEAASVVIDEASLLALSTATNTLTIHGSREDEVIIQGGVAQGTAVGDDGQTYNVFAVGEGMLLVDQDIILVTI